MQFDWKANLQLELQTGKGHKHRVTSPYNKRFMQAKTEETNKTELECSELQRYTRQDFTMNAFILISCSLIKS